MMTKTASWITECQRVDGAEGEAGAVLGSVGGAQLQHLAAEAGAEGAVAG